MFIAWTTVSHRADAERLATDIIDRRLAVCVQIDGPVTSCYRWEGKVEHTAEFRLSVKFLPAQAADLAAWVHAHHPYDVPEWIVVRASEVGEKYLSWARATSSNPPL